MLDPRLVEELASILAWMLDPRLVEELASMLTWRLDPVLEIDFAQMSEFGLDLVLELAMDFSLQTDTRRSHTDHMSFDLDLRNTLFRYMSHYRQDSYDHSYTRQSHPRLVLSARLQIKIEQHPI